MEQVVGDYLESLTGLVESLTEEMRARMSVQEQDARRLGESMDRLTAAIRGNEAQLRELRTSIEGLQSILDAELARVTKLIGEDRERVLGTVLETRDRLHEAELSLLDAYTRRPQAPRTEG